MLAWAMDTGHDYPIVWSQPCVRCGEGPVYFTQTDGICLYLQCQGCGHQWTEPERRKDKMAGGNT
jgi:hypothetical protein